MSDKPIVTRDMLDRFAGWRLPDDFTPDCGVSFKPVGHGWPTGTNLLTYEQAREMLAHVIGASQPQAAGAGGDAVAWAEPIIEALRRCDICWGDDAGADIGRDKLDALTAFGLLEKVGRGKWKITDAGFAAYAPGSLTATPAPAVEREAEREGWESIREDAHEAASYHGNDPRVARRMKRVAAWLDAHPPAEAREPDAPRTEAVDAFEHWLDTPISDCGHVVRDMLECDPPLVAARAAWNEALAHAAPPEADRTAGEAVAWLLLRSDAEGDWQSAHSDHGACSPAEATVRAMAEMLGGRVVPLYARADLAPEAVEAAHSLIDAYRRAFNATGWKLWGPLDNEIARLESAIAAHPPAAAAPPADDAGKGDIDALLASREDDGREG